MHKDLWLILIAPGCLGWLLFHMFSLAWLPIDKHGGSSGISFSSAILGSYVLLYSAPILLDQVLDGLGAYLCLRWHQAPAASGCFGTSYPVIVFSNIIEEGPVFLMFFSSQESESFARIDSNFRMRMAQVDSNKNLGRSQVMSGASIWGQAPRHSKVWKIWKSEANWNQPEPQRNCIAISKIENIVEDMTEAEILSVQIPNASLNNSVVDQCWPTMAISWLFGAFWRHLHASPFTNGWSCL